MNAEAPSRESTLFISLVQSLVGSAWIALGKVANPLTQQISLNMKEAELSIDLLTMLENKTRGNLTPDEQIYLTKALSDLRMNYLEIKLKSPEPKSSSPSAPEQQP